MYTAGEVLNPAEAMPSNWEQMAEQDTISAEGCKNIYHFLQNLSLH